MAPPDSEDNAREPSEEALATTEEFFSELKARGNGGSAPAGEVTDKQLYKELNKRRDFMLESELYGELQNRNTTTPTRNITNILPDPERTPNEVIMLLLEALRTNDEPYKDHGIEVFYRFTSPSSVTYEFELDRVAGYIKSSKYALLTRWDAINYPRPLDMSLAGNRAYQLLRLRDSEANCWQVVSFSLSQHGGCWLLDSVIVKSK